MKEIFFINPHVHQLTILNKPILYNPYNHDVTLLDSEFLNYWNLFKHKKVIEEDNSEYQKLLLDNNFISSNQNSFNYFQNPQINFWLNKKLEIYQLYLIINRKCNFKCRYCRQFTNKSLKNHDQMTLEVAMKTTKKFLEQKTTKKKGVVFYGGEPALSFPLVIEIIKFIRTYSSKITNGNEVEINIFTNGTMIDLQTAKFLSKNNVFIIISFDGLPHQNDKMRIFPNGRGTSKEILEGIKVYKEAGCNIGISYTIGSHNISELESSIEYIKSLNAINLGFNLPHDDEQNPLRPKNTTTDWIDEIISFFWNETKKGLYTEHIIRKIKLFVTKNIKICECPAANGRIVVLPDGKIGLCEGAIGYDNFFLNSDNSWDALDLLSKAWKEKLPFFDEKCKSCPAIGLCGGGCMLDGYFENGILSNYNTVRCIFTKKLLFKILKEIIDLTDSSISCYRITDDDRKKLWNTLVHNHDIKPLTTSANFGEISL